MRKRLEARRSHPRTNDAASMRSAAASFETIFFRRPLTVFCDRPSSAATLLFALPMARAAGSRSHVRWRFVYGMARDLVGDVSVDAALAAMGAVDGVAQSGAQVLFARQAIAFGLRIAGADGEDAGSSGGDIPGIPRGDARMPRALRLDFRPPMDDYAFPATRSSCSGWNVCITICPFSSSQAQIQLSGLPPSVMT